MGGEWRAWEERTARRLRAPNLNKTHTLTRTPTPTPPDTTHDTTQCNSTRSYWTEAFARPDSGDHEAKVSRIAEMGFPRADAERALAAAAGDENAALEQLLGGS